MKELSIEQKAKRYDEALEKSKRLYEQGTITESLCYVFPELVELEDEKIREEIMDIINSFDVAHLRTAGLPTRIPEYLAWLEKQDEHKKFRESIQIGDEVTRNKDGMLVNLSQLKRVAKPAENKGKHNMGISEATKQELEDNLNKALEKETPESCNEFLDKQGENSVCKVKIGETYKCIASPRYTCFRKGDTYHVEDNFVAELINICSGCFVLLEKQGEQKAKYHDVCDKCVRQPTCQSDCFLQQEEQKPAWSEEDEKQARQIERIVSDDGCTQKLQKQIADWLKSLKERIQPQTKYEWSEDDEKYSSYICAALDCYYRLREDRNNTNGQEDLDKARNWLYNRLKSLKPQNTWKPSESDILLLERIANGKSNPQDFQASLCNLIEQLKKLREE